MANEKILNTRIQLKYDTLANWNASSVILKPGELAIVQVPTVEASTLQPVMFKVGDGSKTFSQLDWASAKAADVYTWAKKSGIDVIDNGTGNVVSDIEWIDDALVITRIDAKTKQAEVANKITDKAHVLTTLTQNANGEISYDVKKLTLEDIGAQPAGNYQAAGDYKTKQEQYSESGSTAKTITKVEQNANGEVTVTYEDIAFPITKVDGLAGIEKEVIGTEVYLSVKTDNSGNVHLSNSTYGLKAEVDLSEYLKSADEATYGIEYDKDNKVIKLTNDSSKTSIDATDFIKDGMIESVKLEENTLVITWNTDAGLSKTEIELDHLIDVYTGVDGTTVKVTVDGNAIGAEVKASSIKATHLNVDSVTTAKIVNGNVTKEKLATDVQASLNLADTAVQPITLDNYKTKQKTVADPTKDGTSQTNEFIASISQNENGEITATKKSVNFSEYAKKIDLTNAIGDGVLTLIGNEGLTGSAEFSANQDTDKEFTVGIANKGVTTDKIADGAVGAAQIKASKEYHDTAAADAEVWVFNCGSATELID